MCILHAGGIDEVGMKVIKSHGGRQIMRRGLTDFLASPKGVVVKTPGKAPIRLPRLQMKSH